MTPLDMSVIVFGIFAILFGIAALLMLVAWMKIHSASASDVPRPGPWAAVGGGGGGASVKKTTETRS